jgi:hypothetical protein
MAKIAVSLNEVVRDFLGQLVSTHNKYLPPIYLVEGDVTDFNLVSHFNFTSVNQMNNFIFLEAPLEIFGHADVLTDGLMNSFNNLIMDISDDEEHTIEITSREVDKSIPSTFFYLSKTGCKIKNIRFVTQNIDEWGDADVLITANPIALANKPNGKISVKVNASYNTDVNADFTIDSLLEFINDINFRNTVLNTKIISYEE